MNYKVGVITSSDKASIGEREDISGKRIIEILEKEGYLIEDYQIVPDERELLEQAMKKQADELGVHLILTTGGTGFSKRDCTPEATQNVIERQTPGISEAIRAYSMSITKRSMLSRAVSGIRSNTLIINLPGSPKAVEESLTFLISELKHGLDILNGTHSECARK